jgi:hypothetical protein
MTNAAGVAVDFQIGRELLQQSLDFDLSFRGTCHSSPEMEHGLFDWRKPLDARIYQHESSASKHAVRQKEIAETIGVKSLYSSSFYNPAHSRPLPALGHNAAKAGTCTRFDQLQSYKTDTRYSYGGCSSFYLNASLQTEGFAPAGCVNFSHNGMVFQ